MNPKVSIICLCYNQAKFVELAINSVLNQTYKNIELIIYDDSSQDESQDIIESVIGDSKEILFMKGEENLGNCKAFNRAFQFTTGDYIIDLAADDVLLPNRVEAGINDFLNNDNKYGVHFTNAEFIDENGVVIGKHSEENADMPQGDVYIQLIRRYFINPVTMMIRKEVLTELGGYNEALLYEDFDFWIRSSRKWLYLYNPMILSQKREVPNSLSKKQMQFLNKYHRSTLEVCKTIWELNTKPEEDKALRERVIYEIKRAITSGNFNLVPEFYNIYNKADR